jgi:Zn finger protein HypA/HybF involved in hydrogenase expression
VPPELGGTGFGPWGQRRTVPAVAASTEPVLRHEPGRFACESCGAILSFEPGSSELVCGYCGHRNQISEAPVEIVEHDLAGGLRTAAGERLDTPPLATKCASCAADFALPAGLHADLCPFCRMPTVLDPSGQRAMAPGGVLPFLLGEGEARKLLNAWLHSLWFAPSRLKEGARRPGSLEGVYVPHWTFDASTRTDYRGRRGDVYYETRMVTRVVNGRQVREAVQVPKIRWTPVSGRVARDFDDVLVVAGTRVEPRLVHELAPWDLPALKPYGPDYLSGFESELYRLPLADGYARAKDEMNTVIAMDVRRSIGGDQQVIERMQVEFGAPTYKLVLLPVWTASFKFLGRDYPFVVNGRTGEVHGTRPYSAWKIAGAVLLALVAVLLLALVMGGLDGLR